MVDHADTPDAAGSSRGDQPVDDETDADGQQADTDGTDDDTAGVDHLWVMQVTFVVTIIVGAPLVALLSAGVTLPTWEARVSFAVRVGGIVWFCTAIAVFVYARFYRSSQSET